tara:strand:- start:1197 stop:1754 length:558 start_codon:yes stop_codon:yes gene_type:complete
LTDALYTQTKVLSDMSLGDLEYFRDTVGEYDAKVTKSGGNVYKDIRNAKIKDISHRDFPDVCQELLEILKIHRPKLITEKHEIREFNYLCYGVGGHFKKHRDYINSNNNNKYSNRVFSTITLINKSSNLEGGDLLIWDDNEEAQASIIELEVGETVIFHSMRFHQVTPIVRGTREVLVSWIYLKK